jgi:hypothetical protein
MISHLFFSWQSSSSFVPDCEQSLKPVIGMSFDSLDELEGFYKTYARVYVRLGQDKRYYIASFVEEHNHGLVSPDKIPFLRSNRTICHP